jgi:hypothetical protein
MEKRNSKQREEAKEQYYCWWVLSVRHLYNTSTTLSLTLYSIFIITHIYIYIYIYICLKLLEPVNIEPIDSTSKLTLAQGSIESRTWLLVFPLGNSEQLEFHFYYCILLTTMISTYKSIIRYIIRNKLARDIDIQFIQLEVKFKNITVTLAVPLNSLKYALTK